MSRFENSLALAKSSWDVLRDDKQLTLLPLFSLIATVALTAVGGLVDVPPLGRQDDAEHAADVVLVVHDEHTAKCRFCRHRSSFHRPPQPGLDPMFPTRAAVELPHPRESEGIGPGRPPYPNVKA